MRWVYRFLLAISLMAHSALGQIYAPTSVEIPIVVLSESEEPVSGAAVSIGSDTIAGSVELVTDESGIAVYHGTVGVVFGLGVEAPGFYRSSGRYWEANPRQPAPPERAVVRLRKIDEPATRRHRIRTDLPVLNQPVGFDLEKGDWVAPYGDGMINDFIFVGHREIRGDRGSSGFITISFSNKMDGIQSFSAINPRMNLSFVSSFVAPSKAPRDGYESRLSQEIPGDHWVDRYTDSINGKSRNYVFRVRTKEVDGKIIQASYGWILGEVEWEISKWHETLPIRIDYFFDPTADPEVRSLEPKDLNDLRF